MNMPMRIPQHTQMSKILRLARITPTMLQIQTLQGLIRRVAIVTRAAFFGVAEGLGTAFFAVEEGTVGGEAGGENADVEFDHCPDVDGDIGPWDGVSVGSVFLFIVCLGGVRGGLVNYSLDRSARGRE